MVILPPLIGLMRYLHPFSDLFDSMPASKRKLLMGIVGLLFAASILIADYAAGIRDPLVLITVIPVPLMWGIFYLAEARKERTKSARPPQVKHA